jgi:hypothetical protein
VKSRIIIFALLYLLPQTAEAEFKVNVNVENKLLKRCLQFFQDIDERKRDAIEQAKLSTFVKVNTPFEPLSRAMNQQIGDFFGSFDLSHDQILVGGKLRGRPMTRGDLPLIQEKYGKVVAVLNLKQFEESRRIANYILSRHRFIQVIDLLFNDEADIWFGEKDLKGNQIQFINFLWDVGLADGYSVKLEKLRGYPLLELQKMSKKGYPYKMSSGYLVSNPDATIQMKVVRAVAKAFGLNSADSDIRLDSYSVVLSPTTTPGEEYRFYLRSDLDFSKHLEPLTIDRYIDLMAYPL